MGRFAAAAQVAAFFLIAISSPLAQACENCDSAPAPAAGKSTARNVARLDVTAAVDVATSFVKKALRSLNPSYDVLIVENDAVAESMTVAEYAAAYDASDGQRSAELPGFKHRTAWQLTYRDDGMEAVAQPTEPRPASDVTLDDSWVFGLRFEMAYGWKR